MGTSRDFLTFLPQS